MNEYLLGAALLVAVAMILMVWNGSKPAQRDARTNERAVAIDEKRFEMERAQDERREQRYTRGKIAADMLLEDQALQVIREERKKVFPNRQTINRAYAAIEAVKLSNGQQAAQNPSDDAETWC